MRACDDFRSARKKNWQNDNCTPRGSPPDVLLSRKAAGSTLWHPGQRGHSSPAPALVRKWGLKRRPHSPWSNRGCYPDEAWSGCGILQKSQRGSQLSCCFPGPSRRAWMSWSASLAPAWSESYSAGPGTPDHCRELRNLRGSQVSSYWTKWASVCPEGRNLVNGLAPDRYSPRCDDLDTCSWMDSFDPKWLRQRRARQGKAEASEHMRTLSRGWEVKGRTGGLRKGRFRKG